MAWADPLGDLRRLLADTPHDNWVKEKRLLGAITGQNNRFFTFEDRLLCSGVQYGQDHAMRVWVVNSNQQTELAASGINVLDSLRGEVALSMTPSGAMKLMAAYAYQEFLDEELNMALTQAAYQVNADVIADVPNGLQLPALHIAASMAYARAANRWQQRKSEQFLLQDEPARQEAEQRITFCQAQSERLLETGLKARESFYNMRMDRGKAPAWGLLTRQPMPYTPRR